MSGSSYIKHHLNSLLSSPSISQKTKRVNAFNIQILVPLPAPATGITTPQAEVPLESGGIQRIPLFHLFVYKQIAIKWNSNHFTGRVCRRDINGYMLTQMLYQWVCNMIYLVPAKIIIIIITLVLLWPPRVVVAAPSSGPHLSTPVSLGSVTNMSCLIRVKYHDVSNSVLQFCHRYS